MPLIKRHKTLCAIAISISLQGCNGSQSNDSIDFELPPSQTPINVMEIFGPDNFVRIADGESGFNANIDGGDRFGRDHDNAGDINGDGIIDLVVGARSDDDGAIDAGAVYILFMNADGSVASNQKISMESGLFNDTLDEGAFFGYGVAGVGDYNGDHIPDIAVSSPAASDPAVYILHLNSDGTVKSMTKNSGIVAQGLSAVGDINQDGKIDLIAAQPNATDGGTIKILFFDSNSEIIDDDIVTIGANLGGFNGQLNPGDSFGGRESALLGDIDHNGSLELAVGAFESDNGLGAIWILSLEHQSYEVVDAYKIAPGLAGFNTTIPQTSNPNGTIGSHFGHALATAGDLNDDGIPDLITGANQYNNGVGYILYLNADKTVKTFTQIDEANGGFQINLQPEERFSRSISIVNDSHNDTITVNMGGGAGVAGSIYSLTFKPCQFRSENTNTFWSEGVTLFSNWDHNSQIVTGPLSFEQCSLKAFEVDANNITAKVEDGRCIIKDDSAILSVSDEGSQAYTRHCD